MVGFLGNAYPWVKAAHVIFVIFLMAALFMVPRFFIYHQQCEAGSEEDRKWIEREDRLRRIILNPSIILVWLFGLMLAADQGLWGDHWFQAKLFFVLILSAYHGWTVGYCKKLAKGLRPLGDKQLRLLNEVPGMLAAIVVILVIVRPF